MAHAYLLALAEERRKQNLLKIYRRRLRDKSDPLQLTEIEFRANFRLSKSGFQQVLAELTPYLPQMRRTTAVSNEIKCLVADESSSTVIHQIIKLVLTAEPSHKWLQYSMHDRKHSCVCWYKVRSCSGVKNCLKLFKIQSVLPVVFVLDLMHRPKLSLDDEN